MKELILWAQNRWALDEMHGLPHWQRVEANGIALYEAFNNKCLGNPVLEKPDLTVIRHFAYLHDSGRVANHGDRDHGLRSAEIATSIRNTLLKDLTDSQYEKLLTACREHTRSHRTGDITIDICFDADRLDLPRAGITPDPEKMATEVGAEIARQRYGDVTQRFSIRKATADDAPFVAWAVLTALDLDSENLQKAINSCSEEESLYSWKHAILAIADDKPVGCLIAYEGNRYMALRDKTWEKIWGKTDDDYLKKIEPETKDGEFYLDTMAILPEYRGYGIGKVLIGYTIETRNKPYDSYTLIVSTEKPQLQSYYQSIGFQVFGSMEFFGHRYNRMRYHSITN